VTAYQGKGGYAHLVGLNFKKRKKRNQPFKRMLASVTSPLLAHWLAVILNNDVHGVEKYAPLN